MSRRRTALVLAALPFLGVSGLCAAEPAGAAGPVPPANGTYFTPVAKPTPLYVKPQPEAPLLKTPINKGLSRIGTSEYHEFFIVQDATRILTRVRSFSTSEFSFHVMAVREDGTIYAWGRNANGVLGNRLSPYDVTGPAFKAFEPVGESYAPNIYDMPFPILVQPF